MTRVNTAREAHTYADGILNYLGSHEVNRKTQLKAQRVWELSRRYSDLQPKALCIKFGGRLPVDQFVDQAAQFILSHHMQHAISNYRLQPAFDELHIPVRMEGSIEWQKWSEFRHRRELYTPVNSVVTDQGLVHHDRLNQPTLLDYEHREPGNPWIEVYVSTKAPLDKPNWCCHNHSWVRFCDEEGRIYSIGQRWPNEKWSTCEKLQINGNLNGRQSLESPDVYSHFPPGFRHEYVLRDALRPGRCHLLKKCIEEMLKNPPKVSFMKKNCTSLAAYLYKFATDKTLETKMSLLMMVLRPIMPRCIERCVTKILNGISRCLPKWLYHASYYLLLPFLLPIFFLIKLGSLFTCNADIRWWHIFTPWKMYCDHPLIMLRCNEGFQKVRT
ncbi:MAG: hypothetical protein MRY21_07630 [Simkaniaceae bacterium]|nr:hypothetical protein [Simkaniaceae bacterium]